MIKMIKYNIVLLLQLIIVSGFSQETDEQKINGYLNNMFVGFDREDYSLYYELLHPNAITTGSGVELYGSEAAMDFFDKGLAVNEITIYDLNIIETTVSGNLAISHLKGKTAFSPKDGPKSPPIVLSEHYVWKREDGKWWIYRNSWTVAEDADEVAMKDLIENETNYYYEGEIDRFKDCYSDKDGFEWVYDGQERLWK